MANQTTSWTVESDLLPSTADPATLEDSGQLQIAMKMSLKQFSIYMTMLDADFYLSIVLVLMAIFCNLCILMVTSYHQSLSVPQVYIAALATCDLLTGIFKGIVRSFYRIRCSPHWARVLCIYTFWPSFGIVTGLSMSASMVTLYLSVDRLISLKLPLQYQALSSPKAAKVLSLSTFIITQILCINYPLRLTIRPNIEDDVLIDFTQYTAIGMIALLRTICFALEFVVRFALPLTVMMVTNTWTLYRIITINRKRKKLAANCKKAQKTKYLAVTVGVVIIFFVTHAARTAFLLDTLIFANQHRGLFITEMANLLGHLLVMANSVVNIFIYLAFDRQFRGKFITLIRCSKIKAKAPDSNKPSPAVTN